MLPVLMFHIEHYSIPFLPPLPFPLYFPDIFGKDHFLRMLDLFRNWGRRCKQESLGGQRECVFAYQPVLPLKRTWLNPREWRHRKPATWGLAKQLESWGRGNPGDGEKFHWRDDDDSCLIGTQRSSVRRLESGLLDPGPASGTSQGGVNISQPCE